MQKIEIKADQFFELLKLKDTPCGRFFAQMIDGNEKEIIFLDGEDKILFNYPSFHKRRQKRILQTVC
jgi:hypothetical protein